MRKNKEPKIISVSERIEEMNDELCSLYAEKEAWEYLIDSSDNNSNLVYTIRVLYVDLCKQISLLQTKLKGGRN